MLIFPSLADDWGDRVTAIVCSGWGHATECVVSQNVPNRLKIDAKKLESFILLIRIKNEWLFVRWPHSPALRFGSSR